MSKHIYLNWYSSTGSVIYSNSFSSTYIVLHTNSEQHHHHLLLQNHFGTMVHLCLHQELKLLSALVGDNTYVMGGFDKSGRVTDIVEVYNLKNNSWTKVTPIPQPLHHTSAAFV